MKNNSSAFGMYVSPCCGQCTYAVSNYIYQCKDCGRRYGFKELVKVS